MEKLTKLLVILTLGVLVITITRLFYFFPNLIFPFWFTLIGYLIYKEMICHKKTTRIHPIVLEHLIPWMLILSIIFLYEGHGMNFAANMISHFLEGVNNTLFNIVYFLDEILSHILMFIGIFILFFAAAILQISRPFSLKMHKDDEIALGIFGALFGIGMGTSFIEGNFPVPGLIMSMIFLPLLLFRHRKHKLHFVIRKYPLNYYIAITLIAVIILLVIYYFSFGGFMPPSEILCSKGYESACAYYSGLK